MPAACGSSVLTEKGKLKMREILFRGKRVDNGEWIYGTPFQEYSNFWGEWEWIIQTKHPLTNVPYMHLQIDRKTVGQYTGLTDKNGKKIFEGDILKIARTSDGTGWYYVPPLDYPVNVVVRWDMCAWMWETLCEDKRYIGFPDAWCHFECEVIGNIHDNPELLEVGAEDGK